MSATSVTVPAAKTVIVADDTAFVRDRFSQALTGAGHNPVPIASVQDLLAKLRADIASIDLLVLDIRMADAGGVELVRTVRKLEGSRRLPLVTDAG